MMEDIVNNMTMKKEFYIQAFPVYPQTQLLIFTGLLTIYLIAMLGNITITIVIILSASLHTPMYYFLSNLSFLDMTFISVTLPKLLFITITRIGMVSFKDCMIQMYFFIATANIESFLLTSMAYDRYAAICNPLHYPLIMNKTVCFLLSSSSWMLGFLNSLLLSLLTSNLYFCRSHSITNFFCDLKALLKLSCSDVTTIQVIILVDNVIIGVLPSMFTMTSYACIISTVLKIKSSEGRAKAFSNCTSHLTTVFIFYVTAFCLYMIPDSDSSQNKDSILSLVYVALVPMVNPLVYSLRNKEVLGALRKIIGLQTKTYY